MTPEAKAKAKAAATRRRNAERVAAYAESLNQHNAGLTKAARLKSKLQELADHPRTEPNVRAVALAKLAKLPAPPPRSRTASEPPPLPRTLAEWRVWRAYKPKRRQAARRAPTKALARL